MLLIYQNEANRPGPSDEARVLQKYAAFTQDIVKSNKFKAGDRLEPA